MYLSDLAVEFCEKLTPKKDYVKKQKNINDNIKKTVIQIVSDKAQTKYKRQKGYYVLLDIPFDPILQSLEKEEITKQITKGINEILKSDNLKPKSVLVVGLGNPKMIADCFGVLVSEKVMVTRHAIKSGMVGKSICEVSSICTNVFGATGLESFDIVKGVTEKIKPDLVILVDTLVAENSARLCSNIQIANVGIVPGSGVDNSRKELSRQTLNTNVITIGIPFVVFASSIIKEKSKNNKNDFLEQLVVMPREINQQVNFCSRVVANAINKSLNPNFNKENIETFFI